MKFAWVYSWVSVQAGKNFLGFSLSDLNTIKTQSFSLNFPIIIFYVKYYVCCCNVTTAKRIPFQSTVNIPHKFACSHK